MVLSEWAAKGDWRLFFLHRDRVAKVTPDDVKRVADQYLQRSNRTVGLFVPTTAAGAGRHPATRPTSTTLVKDYKGGKAMAAGEAFDPTPENIEKRVRRSELSDGLKVALLPKKTPRRGGGGQVDAALRQRGLAHGPHQRHAVPRPADDARHQEAQLPAAPGRAGQA